MTLLQDVVGVAITLLLLPGIGRVPLAHRVASNRGLGRSHQVRSDAEEGEHVYVSGELRYREYEKEVGKSKDPVKMPVAEIHAGEIRRLNPRAAQGRCVIRIA